MVRVSWRNTPAHAANSGASGPVASAASARHHAYIHRRNVGPPGQGRPDCSPHHPTHLHF